MRKRTKTAIICGAVMAALGLWNASFLAPEPDGEARLIAHRGIYHNYHRTGAIRRDECTAVRIHPPEHPYFENSVDSIRAAFAANATMVEVDVAPTQDGQMVLFHDWTLDCRTQGSGNVRDATLAQLQALDIGHGYTADNGQTYPLRGKGVGLMPTVQEGLAASKNTPLMFNFKSKSAAEADILADILERAGRDPFALGDGFYGHANPVERVRERFAGVWAWNSEEAKRCTRDYILMGWTGLVPKSCKNRTLVVPLNYQWLIWGWPNRTIARMKSAGARIILVGPVGNPELPRGLTSAAQLNRVPESFNGFIWTEKIEELGPYLAQKPL